MTPSNNKFPEDVISVVSNADTAISGAPVNPVLSPITLPTTLPVCMPIVSPVNWLAIISPLELLFPDEVMVHSK